MIAFDTIKLGEIISSNRSDSVFVVLAKVNGNDIEILAGTPLIMEVESIKRPPFLVVSEFSPRLRIDNGLTLQIDAWNMDKFDPCDIKPVHSYTELDGD